MSARVFVRFDSYPCNFILTRYKAPGPTRTVASLYPLDRLVATTSYTEETDWHTWLLYRLVDENSGDRDGYFYYSYRADEKTVYQTAYYYILFAKWERAKALSWKPAISPTTPMVVGLDYVKWTKGRPSHSPSGAIRRTEFFSFCGYSFESFCHETNKRCELRYYKQPCKTLVPENGMSFEYAQACAPKHAVVIFTLETEDIGVLEDRLNDDARVF